MASAKSVTREVVQFVPVITLASSFIVAGGVDLGRAGTLFVISAALAVIITVALVIQKARLNPVLLGTNLWLVIGALAFGIPISPLADVVGSLQAAGLFATILIMGVAMTLTRPTGFIGMPHRTPATVRKLSIALLGLTAAILVWSYLFIDNIRLGGGLPFIVLNVTRRVMIRRNQKG